LCGIEKETYTIDEFCATNGKVLDKCNGNTYNPSTTGCCNNATYSLATHFCHSNSTHTCGNHPHNPSTHSCNNNQQYSCNNLPYNPETHSCHGNQTYSCNNLPYNPETHSCHGNQTYSCNNLPYDPNTHFCSKGNAEKIVPRCGGTAAYNGKTHFCHDNAVYAKCGGSNYDPETQFCFNNIKIGAKCGINLQTYYNPNLYTCKPSINPNGIFLINPVLYDGESYEAVLIGTQTWMAKNLNFNASGSVCYNNAPANCNIYGRLYDWATAMGFATSCNNSSCASQINATHRGVCPEDWHLPSNDEWTTLTSYVGSNPGTKLKAANGWYTDRGTDEFGFSALPGGSYADNFFGRVDYSGDWWSATQFDATHARYRGMDHSNTSVGGGGGGFSDDKTFFFSIRCVKD
jgi:uncharacterized protein (TIGR02145 family)